MKLKTALASALSLLLAACAASQFNVPAVTERGDGAQLPGKIIWHDLLSDTPEQTRLFYSELFGWEFEALTAGDANYTLIRHRGKLIGGMVDQNRLPTSADISQWVVVIAVRDIDGAVAELRAAGGTVFTPPTSLGDRGTIAVVTDPQGAVMALLQTRDGDPPDGVGTERLAPQGDFLWNELWAKDAAQASAFYRQLLGYEVEEVSLGSPGESLPYRVLSAGGQVRAGLRATPVPAMPPMWVSYLRVADAQALADILGRVEALGGKILSPATERPAGGMVALIAGPSGAGIALQTWTDEQRLTARAEK